MESGAVPGARPGQVTGTLLCLEGRDALALLHRISTQSLLDLAPGQAAATLFCDFRGRLLHRAIVAVTGDRVVWLLRDDAPALPLADFLARFVFREDVRVTVPREDWSVRLVAGDVGLAPGAVREREGQPHEVQIRPGWALALVPESFNPYEVGLAPEVHLRKGCYTGQEALMRLMTYHSVRRRLVRVRGDGLPPDTPHDLHGEGWITSVAPGGEAPGDPGWIGVAVVRHEAAEPGRELAVGGRTVTIVQAFERLPPLGLS